MTTVNALTERLEDVIKEVRNPTKVKNHYCHTIDIGPSKVFLSMVVMVLVILGLAYAIGKQRQTISKSRIII
jgi:hypothetical protein